MPQRFKHAAWALVPCLGLALPALSQAAAEPRYTYGELGYVNADFDDIDEDGDGWGLGGSYAVHRNFHIIAGYQDVDLGGSNDYNSLALGVGVNYALRPGLDAIGRVGWVNVEVDVGPFNEDDDGYVVEGGVRTMINPQLELNGFVRYLDVGNEDDTSLVLGGLYGIANNVAVGADVEFSDDVTTFFLKARLYFDPFAQIR